MGFYALGIVFNITALLCVKHYKLMIKLVYWQAFILLCLGFVGLVLTTNGMFEAQTNHPEFRTLYELMLSMVCIRLFLCSVLISFLSCFFLCACLACVSGQRHMLAQNNLESMQPAYLKKILKQQAKLF